MDLPAHPESDENGSGDRPATTTSWATRVAVAIVVVLVATLVILHLTGVVGPGSN